MTGDSLTWFWGVIGLVVAFGLAYLGAKSWSSRQHQNQKVDRGSSGIQAGGDVNVGERKPPPGADQ